MAGGTVDVTMTGLQWAGVCMCLTTAGDLEDRILECNPFFRGGDMLTVSFDAGDVQTALAAMDAQRRRDGLSAVQLEAFELLRSCAARSA